MTLRGDGRTRGRRNAASCEATTSDQAVRCCAAVVEFGVARLQASESSQGSVPSFETATSSAQQQDDPTLGSKSSGLAAGGGVLAAVVVMMAAVLAVVRSRRAESSSAESSSAKSASHSTVAVVVAEEGEGAKVADTVVEAMEGVVVENVDAVPKEHVGNFEENGFVLSHDGDSVRLKSVHRGNPMYCNSVYVSADDVIVEAGIDASSQL